MTRSALLISFLILLSGSLTAQVYFSDNFENGLGKWTVSGQDWDTTSIHSRGTGHSITDSPDGNYPTYANTIIEQASSINLSGSNQPVLTFWQWHYVRNNSDYCYVEISNDQGLTWQTDTLFTGYKTSLHYVQIDLSEYKYSAFKIRFRLRDNSEGYAYDGWYIDDVEIKEKNTALTSFPFYDDFENGLGNWLFNGHNWDTTGTNSRGEGHSITDSPDTNYSTYANSSITLANAIDLSTTLEPVLSFWQWHYVRNGSDYCYVEISQDNGFSWIIDTSFTGYATTLYPVQVDLSQYKSSPIMIRFRLRDRSEGYVYDGWYIDDVEVYDKSGNRAPTMQSFTANPILGEAPLDVSFEAQSSDVDGTVSEYFWDFNGDGSIDDSTAMGSNTYTYNDTGIYNATCRVIDDQGALSSPATVQINVYSGTTRLVSVPDDSASANSTFLLPIRINDVSGIAGAEFKLSYDAAILEATDVSTTNLSQGFTLTDSIQNGTVAISMARATGLIGSAGDFVNITFHVLANAQTGQTSQLTLTQAALYDSDTNPITSTTENGLFTVKEGADTTLILQEIFIQPDLDTLSSDQTALYSAFGLDSEEKNVEIDVTWSYGNVFGIPGDISPSSGHSTVFTATNAGDGWIAASYPTATDTLVDTAWVIVGDMKGDINIDETLNVPDAILCLQIAASILDPSLYQNWAADYNDDATINAADAIEILNESLNNLLPKSEPSLAGLTSQAGTAVIYPLERFIESSNLLSVPLIVENGTEVCGMDLTIEYNTSNFTLVDISSGNSSSLLVKNLERAKFSTINLNGLVSENGEIIRLFFQPKNKTATKAGLSIKSVNLFDQKGNAIETRVEIPREAPLALPEQYILHQNYPNPFNPSTTIRYDVPDAGEIFLAVYNVKGQMVRELVNDKKNAGSYTVTWKGENKKGDMVSSGIYFYKVVFNNGTWQDVKKMLFVK